MRYAPAGPAAGLEGRPVPQRDQHPRPFQGPPLGVPHRPPYPARRAREALPLHRRGQPGAEPRPPLPEAVLQGVTQGPHPHVVRERQPDQGPQSQQERSGQQRRRIAPVRPCPPRPRPCFRVRRRTRAESTVLWGAGDTGRSTGAERDPGSTARTKRVQWRRRRALPARACGAEWCRRCEREGDDCGTGYDDHPGRRSSEATGADRRRAPAVRRAGLRRHPGRHPRLSWEAIDRRST